MKKREAIKALPQREREKQTVLVISDTHFPFHHPNTFDFLNDQYKRWKCNAVVHIGDEIDFHAMGQWDTESSALGAMCEFERSLDCMNRLYKLFPNVKACISNHTARPFRKANKSGLPSYFLKDYAEILQAPSGWAWRDSWIIDDVYYSHGMGTSGKDGAINLAITQGMSAAIGHLHSWGSVKYHTNAVGKTIFGLNSGCLIDLDAYGFAYAKNYKTRPTLGCGIVIEGREAHFVPLL